MPFSTGEIIHQRYRIVKLLGQGGFGAVYRTWDLNLQRPCAIKENLETGLESQEQFEREARMLSNLTHPNLPRVTDYFTIQGRGQYLVMDFVEGEDLQEKLDKAGGPLPESQVLPWIEQVSDALSYLHRQKPPIIHRDIKPKNIIVRPDGQAFIVDFGIAKLFDPGKRTTLGARAVTPGYSPIEQYGEGNTDARTDVYALAATLYTLLTASTPPESISRQMGTALPSPRSLNPTITTNAEIALARALELHPVDRFQDVGEFASALRRPASFQRTATPQVFATTAATPVASPDTADQGSSRQRSTLPWTIIGIGAVVVLCAIAIGMGFAFLPQIRAFFAQATSTPTATLTLTATGMPVTDTPALEGADTDGDGLSDQTEIEIGTDPDDADTDDDQLPDQAEMRQSTDPLNPDTDMDALNDGVEISQGSDPLNPDTDHDLLLDGEESSACTNLLDPDTDGDGFTDGMDIDPCDAGNPSLTATVDASIPTDTEFPPTATNTQTPTLPPPDTSGGLIAFNSNRTGKNEIFVIDSLTGVNSQVTSMPGDNRVPFWSPDGEKIAFQSNADGDWEIYVVELATSEIQQITDNNCNDFAPHWSPNGKRFTFYSDCDGNREIYVMDIDSSNRAQLTHTNNTYNWFPTWSPDGSQITYSSNRSGEYQVYVMNADGSSPIALHPGCISTFSPDGKQIAFAHYCTDTGDIWLMDRDGSNAHKITDTDNNTNPAWSRDGTRIVFQSERSGNHDIWMMALDGSAWEQVTLDSARDAAPVWQP